MNPTIKHHPSIMSDDVLQKKIIDLQKRISSARQANININIIHQLIDLLNDCQEEHTNRLKNKLNEYVNDEELNTLINVNNNSLNSK